MTHRSPFAWRRLVVGALLVLPLVGAAPPVSLSATDALAALRGLAGTWKGSTEDGHPMTIEFATHAHGTIVQETQSPGDGDEMVTIYNLDGAQLVATHYCPMGAQGNQPHLALDGARSSTHELRFVFTSLTNLDPATDVHVHDGRLVLLDADHLDREWNVWAGGKQVQAERFHLARQGVH